MPIVDRSIARRPIIQSVRRGMRRRCPACGEAKSFRSYLKLVDDCPHCGEPLGIMRADDIPAYATIFIVGHVVVPLLLLSEKNMTLPIMFQILFWPLLTIAMTLVLLPYMKGAVVGLMWALRLRGDEVH